jgi:hypothetical protein
MRAAGFKAAFDECELSQAFHDPNVRDRALPLAGRYGAAAPAVAAVADKERFNALRLGAAPNHGEINAFDGMISELLTQRAFRSKRSGKY